MEKQFLVSADHEKIMVKDCDLKSFRKRFPDFNPLMDEMRSLLPDGYKFYLVDFIVQDCIPGAQTCRDVRWHFDGDFYKDNSFCKDADGNINLWKLYNLFTGANKSTYIDSFLDRSVNAFNLVEQIKYGLNNRRKCWYLS